MLGVTDWVVQCEVQWNIKWQYAIRPLEEFTSCSMTDVTRLLIWQQSICLALTFSAVPAEGKGFSNLLSEYIYLLAWLALLWLWPSAWFSPAISASFSTSLCSLVVWCLKKWTVNRSCCCLQDHRQGCTLEPGCEQQGSRLYVDWHGCADTLMDRRIGP